MYVYVWLIDVIISFNTHKTFYIDVGYVKLQSVVR